ncbi:MAG: HEAT repeat domain-containing protein [Planctomycetota bacterium]
MIASLHSLIGWFAVGVGVALGALQEPPARAAVEQGAAGKPQAPARAARQQALDDSQQAFLELAWGNLLKRDVRLSFKRGGVERALEDLERERTPVSDRAAALFLLGHVGAIDRTPLLEEAAQASLGLESYAAILGLGELELAPLEMLLELIVGPDPTARECAILAILSSGDPGAVGRLAPLAAGGGPIAETLEALTLFASDRTQAPPSAVGNLWLNLRFRAAVLYGLIDGQSFRVSELERLSTEAAFLDGVVLPLAAQTRWPGVRDHLMSLVIESPGPAVFEAALSAIPAELGLVVRNGIWVPADEQQWSDLVQAIRRVGVGIEMVELLDRALGVESLRREAALLLLEAGDRRGWELVSVSLVGDDPEARREVAVTLGRSSDPDWLLELQRLRDDDDPGVRAAALVARIRLGELAAFETAIRTYSGTDEPERGALIDALISEAADVRVQSLLEQALVTAEEPLSVRIALALTAAGRGSAYSQVRDALATGLYPELAPALVRSLGEFADQADVEQMRRMFPGGDEVLDRELARALVIKRDPLGMRIVRAAIWNRTWHEGVLAALLLADVEGLQALHSELQSPPPLSSASDLRRLGFALGLIGGLQEVERLSLRRNSADPALQGAYLGALAARTY